MVQNSKQKKTLSLLLSGQHPQYKKYAGKHVIIIDDHVVSLKAGKAAKKQFDELKEKYKKSPTLAFVPRSDISYIL